MLSLKCFGRSKEARFLAQSEDKIEKQLDIRHYISRMRYLMMASMIQLNSS